MRWISWPDLVEVIGRPAATDLCTKHGGISTYLPVRADRDHPWCRVLGVQAMTLLCAYAGGNRVSIPNRRRAQAVKRRIHEMLDDHASIEDIARECEVTDRYVMAVAAARQIRTTQRTLPGL